MRALFLVIVLLLAGCGSNDSSVVGDWVGKFVKDDGKKTPGANLTFDKNHHWRELYGNLDVQGTWDLSDHTVTLKTETVGPFSVAEARAKLLREANKSKQPAATRSMAENLDKPMKLSLSADGKSLSKKDPVAGGTVIYERQ